VGSPLVALAGQPTPTEWHRGVAVGAAAEEHAELIQGLAVESPSQLPTHDQFDLWRVIRRACATWSWAS